MLSSGKPLNVPRLSQSRVQSTTAFLYSNWLAWYTSASRCYYLETLFIRLFSLIFESGTRDAHGHSMNYGSTPGETFTSEVQKNT